VREKDEALLSWFFGDGQVAFERSPTGAVLDRAELYSVARDERKARAKAQQRARPKKRAKHASEPWDPNPVTAYPTAEVRTTRGYVPDDTALKNYAKCSRALALVEKRDKVAARALELYYGDAGARWGRTSRGRLFALAHLTDAGQTLLREAADRTKRLGGVELELPAHERMGALADVQQVQPNRRRRELLRQSGVQSGKLYSYACRVWAEVHGG